MPLRIAVASLSPSVREVFTISRLHQLIPLFDSVEAAGSAWDGASQPAAGPQKPVIDHGQQRNRAGEPGQQGEYLRQHA